MDKEQLDHLKDQPANRQAQPTKAGPDSSLQSQLGNRAFTSLIQRSTKSQGAGPLDPEIADGIKSEKGGGQPLDDNTRTDMEGHLDADLSAVRVHTGGKADHLNRSVQAEAFTTGNDVFFKSGKYSPDSSDGRGLLAHELTHVVQQRSGQVGGGSRVSDPGDAHEVEAKSVGAAVASSKPVTTPAAASVGVSRQEEEEELQMSVDRQEEEEELQMSVDRDATEQEEEMEDADSVS